MEVSAKKNRTRLTIKYPMMVDSGESGEADADEMTDEMGDDDMDDMEEGTEEMDDMEEGTDDMDDMEEGTDEMDDMEDGTDDMNNADEMNDMDEMEDEMDDNDIVDEGVNFRRRLEDEDEKAQEETIDGVKYMQAMADYVPVSFELRSPSEHTVDGLTYDLELQFLHATNSGENAIISIFFDREHGGTEENEFLKSLVDADVDMLEDE